MKLRYKKSSHNKSCGWELQISHKMALIAGLIFVNPALIMDSPQLWVAFQQVLAGI